MILSPNQKNALYKAIELQKLNARSFHIEATDKLTIITYKPTGFYFRIQPTEGRRGTGPATVFPFIYYTPLKQGVVFNAQKEASITNADSFEDVTAHFTNWLVLIKQEFEQPDLWAVLEQTPDILIEDAEMMEDRFTPAEIKLLQERVIKVQTQVVALNLPQQTETAIVEILREMPAKAKRLTKKELWEVLFSTILRESLRAGLTSEHTSDIIKTRYQLFHSPI
jgi:hypothetical protein